MPTPTNGRATATASALFTDLYQLTMLQAYYAESMTQTAIFELFFRKLPQQRNYIMAAGLEAVLDFLESLQFGAEEIDWLRSQRRFSEALLNRLRELRFSGDVDAVAEGTLVFADEPVLRIVAPLPEAQLVETLVLNQIHMQSVIASKAARVVSAAGGRAVVDFGSRRAPGTDAALQVARASYLAGASGTSNVAASRRYGVPAFGTMAHSYIQAHPDELSALRAFAHEFPTTTLLVDTYDTLAGVTKVIALANQLGDRFAVSAIRLDSGDLAELARDSRRLLDRAGLRRVQIFASSGLDEYRIAAMLAAGAPVDGFGVGTRLAVSADAPTLDCAYKLVEYAGEPRFKLSTGKVLLPGPKQVFREYRGPQMWRDTVARADETLPGEPLLRPVMRGGRRLEAGRVPLSAAREHARRQLAALPAELQALEAAATPYPVAISPALQALAQRLAAAPR